MNLSIHQAFHEALAEDEEVVYQEGMSDTSGSQEFPVWNQDFREKSYGISLPEKKDIPQPKRDRAVFMAEVDSKILSLQLVQLDVKVAGS